jgi:hypothetical protein
MEVKVSILKTAKTWLILGGLDPGTKGLLHLTTASLLFIPHSKKLPEGRIPLDAIDTLYVPSKFKSFLWGKTGFMIRSFYPLNIKTIAPNSEIMQFYIQDPAGWMTAIKEAADGYFYCLKNDLDCVDKLMDQGKEKEALALCEETIKTCSTPKISAYAYCCLATVQRRRGNSDKAADALNRAKAIRDEMCNGEMSEGMFKRMTLEICQLRFGISLPSESKVSGNEIKKAEAAENGASDKRIANESVNSDNDADKNKERLKILQSLRDEGLISESEYLKKREKIIEGI